MNDCKARSPAMCWAFWRRKVERRDKIARATQYGLRAVRGTHLTQLAANLAYDLQGYLATFHKAIEDGYVVRPKGGAR